MKTYLLYGFGIALCNLLLTLAQFFLGYHSDPAKLGTSQIIATIGSIAICTTGIVLGTKARRDELPPESEFGYGKALFTGFAISIFAALFGAVGYMLYMQVIDPGFNDVIMQAQVAKLEAAGRSADEIERMQAMSRKFMSPVAQSIFALLGTTFFGTVISLVTSAFLKRDLVEKFESA